MWMLSAFADEAADDIAGQVKSLTNAKLKYIDPRGLEGHNIAELPLEVAEKAQKQFEAAGIRVMMYGSPIGKIDIADDVQIDLDKLSHLGKLKDIFGAERVRIFSYYNKAGKPYDQWKTDSLDRLKKLRDLAGQLGLRLYHENESDIFGDRLPENQILAEQLRDGEAFNLIFDFDNYRRGGDDVWQNWQTLKDQTDAFHLKDSDENNQHVPIGTGGGQATEILTDAAKRGWQGPLTLEPHLRHSAAVLATVASGQDNVSLKDKSREECFQIAADVAHELIEKCGGKLA